MPQQSPIIAPSILSANFAKLGSEVDAVVKAGAQWIHFDVMDNHYVPNLTVGAMVCRSLREYGITVPIDVHLMVKPVDNLIKDFANAGADYISFHPDATDNISGSIQLIHNHQIKAGLVLNPDVPAEILDPFFDQVDLILVMSVYPGFAGQAFIPEVLQKVKALRQRIDAQKRSIRLSIDGGINIETAALAAAAGADTFVAGSAIFKTPNYAKTITAFKNIINQAAN
ncbi:MAG: ribulose-phosphate 3-epimerase [Gammaproteobacteria bacterium]|jgi:ribulose-phosphate 3-epimerase|nr:ribulose-phosphate 3-epimerase [Gammaproteobacteria bacterium]